MTLLGMPLASRPRSCPLARRQFGYPCGVNRRMLIAWQYFAMPRLDVLRTREVAATRQHKANGRGGNFQIAGNRDVSLQIQFSGQVGGRPDVLGFHDQYNGKPRMPRTQPRDLAVQPLRLLRGLHPDDGARCARQRIWRQAKFHICHRHGSDFAAVFGEPTGQATADEIPSLDNDERTRQHADLTPHVWIDTPRSERSENVRSLQPDPLFSEWSLLSRGSPKRGEGPQLRLICATPITIHCFTCDQPTMRSRPGYCPIDLVPRLAEGAPNRTSVRRAA